MSNNRRDSQSRDNQSRDVASQSRGIPETCYSFEDFSDVDSGICSPSSSSSQDYSDSLEVIDDIMTSYTYDNSDMTSYLCSRNNMISQYDLPNEEGSHADPLPQLEIYNKKIQVSMLKQFKKKHWGGKGD